MRLTLSLLVLASLVAGCGDKRPAGQPESVVVPTAPSASATTSPPTATTPADAGAAANERPPSGPGRVEVPSVEKVLAAATPAFKKCHAPESDANPTVRVTATFTLLPDGRATNTQIASTPTLATMDACLKKVLDGLVFPKPDGGEVKFNLPLVFRAK